MAKQRVSRVKAAVPPSSLVVLPPEILVMVMKLLMPCDLNRLSRTCKAIYGHAVPILFANLDLKIPLQLANLSYVENLLLDPSNAVAHTKHLRIAIRPYSCDSDSIATHDFIREDSPSTVEIYDENSSVYVDVNRMIRLLINKIPRNRLITFEWSHDYIVQLETLSLLTNRHPKSLRNLHVKRAFSYNDDYTHLKIESFSYTSIQDSHQFQTSKHPSWLSSLLMGNLETLRHLKLGHEMSLMNEYPDIPGDINDNEIRDVSFTLSLKGSSKFKLFKLSSLHLIGIRLTSPSTGKLFRFANLQMLHSLCLESCFDTPLVLALLASAHGVSLKRFWLRCEGESPTLRRSLEVFLNSFSGLEHLYVLLDKIETLPGSACIASTHSKSLKTLIWEGREGPRQSFSYCTSKTDQLSDYGYTGFISTIASCIELEELGIALNWAECLTVGHSPAYHLLRFKHLHTLNIRNFPGYNQEFHTLLNIGDLRHSMLLSFLRGGLHSWRGTGLPALRLIIIGAGSNENTATYTRYYDEEVEAGLLRTVVKPTVYKVDYHRTSKKSMQPVLTELSTGALRQGVYSDRLRILEPCWLK